MLFVCYIAIAWETVISKRNGSKRFLWLATVVRCALRTASLTTYNDVDIRLDDIDQCCHGDPHRTVSDCNVMIIGLDSAASNDAEMYA